MKNTCVVTGNKKIDRHILYVKRGWSLVYCGDHDGSFARKILSANSSRGNTGVCYGDVKFSESIVNYIKEFNVDFVVLRNSFKTNSPSEMFKFSEFCNAAKNLGFSLFVELNTPIRVMDVGYIQYSPFIANYSDLLVILDGHDEVWLAEENKPFVKLD